MLKSLPPTQRKQLLEGNWEISEGAAFTEFDRGLHVIDPFEIPLHWERVKALTTVTHQSLLVFGQQ